MVKISLIGEKKHEKINIIHFMLDISKSISMKKIKINIIYFSCFHKYYQASYYEEETNKKFEEIKGKGKRGT